MNDYFGSALLGFYLCQSKRFKMYSQFKFF